MSKETTLTSTDLIKRSEELRQQAQEMMRKERPEVIARIKEAITHYGLTSADLGLGSSANGAAERAPRKGTGSGKGSAKSAGVKTTKARRTASVKYRDDQGNRWSGFGPKPKWLKEALAGGASEESLRA